MLTLDAFSRALTYCTYCPNLCRHSCPVADAEAREAVTPRAKMALLQTLRTEARPWSSDAASVLYACNGCGLCTRYCAHEVDVASALLAGRSAAVDRHAGHPALADLPKRFYARAARRRGELRAGFPERLTQQADFAHLPGCGAMRGGIESVRRDRALYRRFGIPDVPIADLPFACAGYALWAGGHRSELMRVAEKTAAALARIATLCSSCPACVWMLREVYPTLGARLATRVLHMVEWIEPRLAGVRIMRRPGHALYHDACYLGRHLGILQPPRRLAAACVETLGEFQASRELGQCSGGGGLVPVTAPDTAARTAARRLAEAREAGVHLIVTACPTARRTMAAAGGSPRVVELLDLVAAAAKYV